MLVDAAGKVAMVNARSRCCSATSVKASYWQPVERLLPKACAMRLSARPFIRRRSSGAWAAIASCSARRDGRLIPLEVGLAPIRAGSEMLVQAVIIDISERKAAEERFRLVVEASPNAIVC